MFQLRNASHLHPSSRYETPNDKEYVFGFVTEPALLSESS